MIEVRRVAEGDPLDFEVVVREGRGETRHHVTMSREMCERLTSIRRNAVSRRPSASCSTASRRSRFSDASTRR
jgi:hypothetical protein